MFNKLNCIIISKTGARGKSYKVNFFIFNISRSTITGYFGIRRMHYQLFTYMFRGYII